jgi:DNA polymerase (family 10)
MPTTSTRRRRDRVRYRAIASHAGPTAGESHGVENAEIARLFAELADLLEIEGANPFRIRAYRAAARTVGEHPHSIDAIARETPDALTELPGIGEDLAGKIVEIVRTGSLAQLRAAERHAPKGVSELMRLPGLGPKRARLLCDRLHIRSLDGLARAARAGRVRTLRGFGVATEERILRELEHRETMGERTLLSVATEYGESLLAHIRATEGVTRAELAGSFRRRRETVGDLDLLVAARAGSNVVERFVSYPEVERVLARGRTRAAVRLRCGLNVDLRVLPERSYGAGLAYFTGSKAHNIAIRRLGQRRGLKINEYGVFRGGRRVEGAKEDGVYRSVGLPWIPPELREARGEIEAAATDELPRLITLDDVRGDLQSHTTDSDGRESLEAMAEAAQAMGYEYLAVTDHTPTVRITGGLDRAGFRRQARRIDALNGTLRTLTLLKGAEVDIHADGALDLDAGTLAMLDIVLVSIHSHFDLDSEAQTRRLVRAVSHSNVDVLAHPTGRLIGKRRGAAFDLDAVLDAAADHGVMLEINAQPQRLDLDDVAARAARDRGVTLVISTDAHATPELRFMRWGVDQARRAWLEKKDVANTRPLVKLLPLLHRAR